MSMKKRQDKTIYKALEEWAMQKGLTADIAIELAVERFYELSLSDKRLVKFFAGANLDNLKKHQRTFFVKIFSGEEAGGYTDKYLYEVHENLIKNKGLKTVHFDYFAEHLVGALEEQEITRSIIERVEKLLIPFRKVFEKATNRHTAGQEERLFFALDDDGDGIVTEADIRKVLKDVGLAAEDERLAKLYENLDANGGKPLHFQSFAKIVGSAGLLVERALRGELAIPDFVDFTQRLNQIVDIVKNNTDGQQAQYIPPLAEAEPEKFGLAIVTIDGQVYLRGDHDVDFSIQSMCKPFNYCFAVEELGDQEVHKHVGNEPSGRAFNDRDLMERLMSNQCDGKSERVQIPYNPMINAGAIMTASLVKSHQPFASRFSHIREQWSKLIGKMAKLKSDLTVERALPRFNKEMARQENYTGFNNLALGYLLMGTGKLPHTKREIPDDTIPEDPNDYEFMFEPSVLDALKLYFSTCSLELTAKEMATAAATLANGGVCPLTQERVLKQSTVRSCLSVTQMCGMYDGSGDFFYSIGLPAKSGVGGGVFLVVPKLMGICVFSPRLDRQGNSVRGVDVAKRLIQEYRLHLYDGVMTDSDRVDPRLPLARWRASQSSEALWAASKGDIRTLLRLYEGQFNLEAGDYDQRTPMHIAAAEGHGEVIDFLLEYGIRPMPDRWGGYPISDAIEGEHTEVIEIFRKKGITEEKPNHFVQNPDGFKDQSTEYNDNLAIIELLWAAAENNIAGLRRLVAQGVPVHGQDYDQRTALHLASAEGHLEAVKYLLAHGHPLNVRDRWLATPLDEAIREERTEVIEYLTQHFNSQ